MPSSGGSVSAAPVNKVVDGKSHYLAYITPDEGKSLVDQGGREVVTDSGIPAYPTHFGGGGDTRGRDDGGARPDPGPQGPPGNNGSQGPQGTQGPQGERGKAGSTSTNEPFTPR